MSAANCFIFWLMRCNVTIYELYAIRQVSGERYGCAPTERVRFWDDFATKLKLLAELSVCCQHFGQLS